MHATSGAVPEGASASTGFDPVVTYAGSGAVLLDAARGAFSDAVQRRVWAVGRAAHALEAVREVVPA